MSDTPRTDTRIFKQCGLAVSPEFCRQLERELAAVKADRDSWRQQNNDRVADLLKMSGKRDSALADLNDLRMAYKERGDERDALRAELERLKSYGMQPVSTRLRDLNDQLRQSRDENERLRAQIEERNEMATERDTLT